MIYMNQWRTNISTYKDYPGFGKGIGWETVKERNKPYYTNWKTNELIKYMEQLRTKLDL